MILVHRTNFHQFNKTLRKKKRNERTIQFFRAISFHEWGEKKRSEEEEMKYQFLRRSRREKKIIPRRQQWYNRFLLPTFPSLSSNAYTFMAAILFGNRPQASPPSSQGRLFKPIRIIQFFVCHVPLGHFLVAITRGGPGQALFSTSMFAGRRVDFLPFSPSIIPTPLAWRYLSLFIILVHPRIFFFHPFCFSPRPFLVPPSYSSLFQLGARALFVFSLCTP